MFEWKKNVISLDDFDRSAIIRIMHNLYLTGTTVLTINKI